MSSSIRDAARCRAQQVRTRADRPSQRRSGEEPGSPVRVSAPLARAEVRGLDDPDAPLVFDGWASVTDRAYEMWDMFGPYEETVHVGSFAGTLAREDLDVPLVLRHDSLSRIARTHNAASPLSLTEVTSGGTTGLQVLAPNLPRDDVDVRYIAPKLAAGLVDEMSFMFRIVSGRWSDDWMEYHIHAVDIHRGDVSIVGFGANPHTAGSGLRSQPRARGARSARTLTALIDLELAGA